MKYLLLPLSFLFVVLFACGNLFFSMNNFQTSSFFYELVLQTYINEDGIVNYNLGNTYYRREEFARAIEVYLQGIEASEDEQIKFKLYYNSGNAYFKSGVMILLGTHDFTQVEKFNPEGLTKQDAQEVVRLWLLAIEQYEKALEIDPNDKQAKENLEFVKSLLEQMQQQQQEQEQEQEQQEEEEVDEETKDEIERIEQDDRDSQEADREKRDRDNPPNINKPVW